MNLLVSSTHSPQAYAIICALRPYSKKIVATMFGKNRLTASLSHASTSRLVNKRYHVPSPAADWREGHIEKANTPREEAYVQAILSICDEEQIDSILPCWDPEVYVLCKNKGEFERRGIAIPIPDYDTVVNLLDKYRTVRIAEEIGFPCPRTRIAENDNHLRAISEELGFPLVLKLRVSSGGRGMAIVLNLPELLQRMRSVTIQHYMIQEYIPGRRKQAFSLTLDKRGELKVGFCPTSWRDFPRLSLGHNPVRELAVEHAYLMQAAMLLHKVGWWGGATIETKIDSRDGIPKLMEINPRLGQGLWRRTESGINEPLMCLNISKGEEVQAVKDYPVGTLFIDPVEDMLWLGFSVVDLFVYKFRVNVQGKIPIDPRNPPMTLKEIIHSYKATYFGGKSKAFNPHFKYFFQDPLVSILWWLQFFTWVLGARKELGR